MFIAIQKYTIGQWCPICLTIAFFVGLAACTLITRYVINSVTVNKEKRGNIMKKILWKTFGFLSFSLFGFILAFIGVTRPDFAEAAANTMKNKLELGNAQSDMEVYFITDWFCPACRQVEPNFIDVLNRIMPKTAVFFVDYPVHPQSMNYIPYNMAFLAHNKDDYLRLRQVLSDLSQKTKDPDEEDIREAASSIGVHFKELNYSDIKGGLDFFGEIVKQFNVKGTPTLIIVNNNTKKYKKLQGGEISQENIFKNFDALK
jgi:hypothetical protein